MIKCQAIYTITTYIYECVRGKATYVIHKDAQVPNPHEVELDTGIKCQAKPPADAQSPSFEPQPHKAIYEYVYIYIYIYTHT